MEAVIRYFQELESRLKAAEERLARQESLLKEQSAKLAEAEALLAALEAKNTSLAEQLKSQPLSDKGLPEIEVELVIDDNNEEDGDVIADEPLLEDEATEELLTADELQAEDELEDKLVEAIENPVAEQKTGVTLPSVDDIRKAISLGDRFLFQRELFGGDGEKMNKTIDRLNAFESLEEAMTFINKKFSWDKESQAYELFVNILHRRF